MQRILFAIILSLSLMICLPSSLWAGGLDDLDAGITAGKTGNYDEAIRLCTKAIESGELSGKNLSSVYCTRGTAWAEKGDYDKAIADINKAIEIDPKDAMAYYNRGLA
ncbi:MAG: hypothetical protein A2Z08_03775, partial [Deltaproteobacteria bacterium RBG_16_54_11]